MTNVRTGFVLTVGLLLGGCYPVVLPAACRAQVDECLKRCDPAEPPLPDLTTPQDNQPDSDIRSMCVRTCHDICT